MTNQRVSEYYNKSLFLYKLLWHQGKSNGMHYGFWDKHTKNLQDAILNQNKFMAEKAKIKRGDLVLDAGCGVGGSSFWLAKNKGAKVVGVTISQKQIKVANQLKLKMQLGDQVEFKYMDYLKTDFPANHFDVVWGCESICYAPDKRDFIKEAKRILKPGGRLIVADGVLLRELKPSEEKSYNSFLEGFVLDNISQMDDFEKWLIGAGFKAVKVWNKTPAVLKSSKRLYRMTLISYLPFKLLNFVRIIPAIVFNNTKATYNQYRLVKSGAAGYAAYYAEKP